MHTETPSPASQAARRSKLVSLTEWDLEDGTPLRVLCTETGADVAQRELGVLPGERPRLGLQDGDTPEEQREGIERLMVAAPGLIEAGTSLLGPDGQLVRPAFAFDDEGLASHPHALDGRKLDDVDLMLLATTFLRLNGYLGVASAASFRRARGIGTRLRPGTLAVLPSHGDPAQAGPG